MYRVAKQPSDQSNASSSAPELRKDAPVFNQSWHSYILGGGVPPKPSNPCHLSNQEKRILSLFQARGNVHIYIGQRNHRGCNIARIVLSFTPAVTIHDRNLRANQQNLFWSTNSSRKLYPFQDFSSKIYTFFQTLLARKPHPLRVAYTRTVSIKGITPRHLTYLQ